MNAFDLATVAGRRMAIEYLQQMQSATGQRLLVDRVEDLIAKNKEREELAMPTGDCGSNMQIGRPELYLGGYDTPQPMPPKIGTRDVRIQKVLNGYRVMVGCQELAFESAESLLSELKRYLKNPDAIEKEYLEKA